MARTAWRVRDEIGDVGGLPAPLTDAILPDEAVATRRSSPGWTRCYP